MPETTADPMRIATKYVVVSLAFLALAACNPTYLPVNPVGIAGVNEFEAGAYASFGYVGRTVRPLGFRGVVANFGVYFRKGVADGVDWTVAVDNCTVNTAFGFKQKRDESVVVRPRVGFGWTSGFAGVDYSWRLSQGKWADYAVGATALAWVGDAYWTDDPGRTWGMRFGALGYVGAEPKFESTVSGGLRADWAPLQFGAKGERETLIDLFGGNRNPYAEPTDRSLWEGWPETTFAFEPAAFVFTGSPALTYHQSGGIWTAGGENKNPP
jgi:hypothetical protein